MKMDDKLTDLPPSFEAGIQSNYLGSPKVVEGILGRFIEEIVGWVQERQSGAMPAEKMTALAYERSHAFADIFGGDNKEYSPIVGWNSRTAGLSQYLKADLGHYWQSHRAAFGDDPLRVFYGWLLWAVVDSMSIGDDDLASAKMGSRIEQAVRLLTGSTKRK